MTLRSMSRTSAAVLAVVGLFWSSPRAWAQTPPNYRVNDILGPDELLGTVDDDDPNYDPNDPNDVLPKKQNETTIALIRAADGSALRIFGAWNDGSWADDGGDPNRTIGFGLSSDMTGQSWPMHNLARSADRNSAVGYLPPPVRGGPPQWLASQHDPIAAVIPRGSGITGVHLVGRDVGPPNQGRIFYARTLGVPTDDPNDWDVKTIRYGDLGIDKPFISVYGPPTPEGKPKYVCVSWTEWGIRVVASGDGGESFSTPAVVNGPRMAQWSASAFGPGPGGGDDPYV